MAGGIKPDEWVYGDGTIPPDDPRWADAPHIGGLRYITTHENRWVTVERVDPRTGEPKKFGVHLHRWWVACRSHFGLVTVFRKYRHNKAYLFGDSRNDAPPAKIVGVDKTYLPTDDRGVKAIRRKPRDRGYVVSEVARMYFGGHKEIADLFLQSVGM
jgi:hypothetical protein